MLAAGATGLGAAGGVITRGGVTLAGGAGAAAGGFGTETGAKGFAAAGTCLAGGVGGVEAAPCCLPIIAFSTSPGFEMCDKSILVLIPSGSGRLERAGFG